MKILLCCAGGFSTTMLMENIKKVVKNSKKLDEKDFALIAIPAETLESEIDNYDIVLVGPQISHKIDFIKSLAEPRNKPYLIIDKDVYGSMDGATVLKMALIKYTQHSKGIK
ncbi:MAG: PTS sugar transporter subunit IIB [Clostridium sp.]|uniref:PTS sugar transporter subunit IIB n=1 Tax=Clostridium sp. TaxID=1506 RepID=UPI002FCBA409